MNELKTSLIKRKNFKKDYLYVKGKKKEWVYIKNIPDMIYYFRPTSEEIEIETLNKGIIKFKPQNESAELFQSDTDIDLTENFNSFGVISPSRVNDYDNPGNYIYDSIIYIDLDWTVGSKNRIKNIAKKIAIKENKNMYFSMFTEVFEFHGFAYPDDLTIE